MLQTIEAIPPPTKIAAPKNRLLAFQSAVIVVEDKLILRRDRAGSLSLPGGELLAVDPTPKQSLSLAIWKNHGFELLIDFLLVLEMNYRLVGGAAHLDVVWGGYARYPFSGAENAILIPKRDIPWQELPSHQWKATRMWLQALETGAIALPWW